MALASIIGGHSNIGTRKPVSGQQLRSRARALKHGDLASARDEGLHNSREHGDAEAAGDADRGPRTAQFEAMPKRAEQVELVTRVSG